MDDLSIRDIQQLFNNCLIAYKGTPSFVHRVNEDRTILIQPLGEDKVNSVNFKLEDFKSVNARLGYINTAIGCAYLKRRPVRRYCIGVSTENCQVEVVNTHFDAVIKQEILGLRSGAITHTINGDFPDLATAWETALSLNSCFAFDRQFAVRYDGIIIYRGRIKVGRIDIDPDAPLDIHSIKFTDDHAHLITLLDGSYGKSL